MRDGGKRKDIGKYYEKKKIEIKIIHHHNGQVRLPRDEHIERKHLSALAARVRRPLENLILIGQVNYGKMSIHKTLF
jgi:hypothetical protein